MMKSKWLLVIFAALYVFIVFNREPKWREDNIVFKWDKFGYYSYLPASFIYHDVSGLSFYNDILYVYQFTNREPWWATYEQPNGRRLNKYAIGVSCFELPFFAAAHVYTKVSKTAEPDGYSLPYQWAMFFCSIFWTIVGLCFLRAFLLRHFTDWVTTITLLCIGLGTNLYYYAVFDPGMSHPYSFMLFAALLFYTDLWHRQFKLRHLCATGIVLGFIAITRPVNLAIVLLPVLWQVYNLTDLKNKMRLFIDRYKQIIIAFCCFLAVALIQMSYWHYITGHWIFFSYQDEFFNFSDPQILNGLFSFRKGWFVYTPIAFIGSLGFYHLWKKDKKLLLAPLSSLIVLIYLVFSWYCWWYGGSFGCRPLIEAMAVMALPLAALVEAIATYKYTALKIAASTVIVFFIALNLFQSYQFSYNIIHYDRMTAVYYWRVFGKLKLEDGDSDYLMDEKKYWAEWPKKK